VHKEGGGKEGEVTDAPPNQEETRKKGKGKPSREVGKMWKAWEPGLVIGAQLRREGRHQVVLDSPSKMRNTPVLLRELTQTISDA